eukprot:GFUD01039114.1.p1 GENE.GFUD01039114.1~~GFUD01039114.1.p1  ORF type:complete len:239 (+),score=17.88 GFUD01039114.1:48-764(+)
MLVRMVGQSGLRVRHILSQARWNCATASTITLSSQFHTSTMLQLTLADLKKKGNMKSSAKLTKKDGVPSDYQLVYRLGMESYIEPTKYLAFISGITTLVILPLLVLNQDQLPSYEFMGNLSISSGWESYMMLGVILNHALAGLYIAHKVPLRMYFSEESNNFIIVMNHFLLPWKKSLLTVEGGDVTQLVKDRDIWQMNNFRHCFLSSKRVFYMGHNYFMTGFYYKKLLGINSEESDQD